MPKYIKTGEEIKEGFFERILNRARRLERLREEIRQLERCNKILEARLERERRRRVF